MVDIALNAGDGPIPLHSIAKRQAISESYLEQVFTSLRKSGLVKALRGAQGGYKLGRPAGEITVGEIIRALEGPITPVYCVEEKNAKKRCERESICVTRTFWAELRDKLNEFMDSITLQDLADKARTNMPENPMYFI